ncbi:hypothetical protein DEO72_LG9g2766 [Vigna unguiculata]|uniref:Uncharacterized protein n=1 Tax=Vigna unguiculata TaxID=3917 RepID=A0A4D6N1U1_VIGUN|nr:hypothetical protein DEO72_LG9g2766 [Vigna unguiculata]
MPRILIVVKSRMQNLLADAKWLAMAAGEGDPPEMTGTVERWWSRFLQVASSQLRCGWRKSEGTR